MQFKSTLTAPDHPFGATLGLALGLMLRVAATLRSGGRAATVHARRAAGAAVTGRPTADDTLRIRVLARLAGQEIWHGATANVFVADGVVIFQGLVRREADRPAALRALQGLPGVRGVRDDRIRSREWQAMA